MHDSSCICFFRMFFKQAKNVYGVMRGPAHTNHDANEGDENIASDIDLSLIIKKMKSKK